MTSSFRRDVARRGQGGLAAVELELAGERANALGRAGDRLAETIDTWRLLVEVGAASHAEVERALHDVRDAAWALIVQRECTGFRLDNLGWIRRNYDIPPRRPFAGSEPQTAAAAGVTRPTWPS